MSTPVPAARSQYDYWIEDTRTDPDTGEAIHPLGGVGLMIRRARRKDRNTAAEVLAPKATSGQYTASEVGKQLQGLDVPWSITSWAGGAGSAILDSRYPDTIAEGENIWNRDASIIGPSGYAEDLSAHIAGIDQIRTMFEFVGYLWFAGGEHLTSALGADPTALASVSLPPGSSVVDAAVFNGNAYMGSGTAGLIQLAPTGGISTLTGVNRGYLAPVYWVIEGVGGYRLVATNGDASVTWVAGDPLVALNWSASIAVGDSAYSTLSLVSSNYHVWAGRQDGLFDMDGRGFAPNVTPAFRTTVAASSGQFTLVHDDYVYINHQTYGIARIPIGTTRVDTPEWCGFGVNQANETGINGTALAGCSDGTDLLCAFYSVTPSGLATQIMAGRDRRRPGVPPGPGPIRWSGPELTIPNFAPHAMHVTTYGDTKRLWVAGYNIGTGASGLWVQSMPKSGNPVVEWQRSQDVGTEHRFQISWSVTQSAFDYGDGTALKTPRRFEVVSPVGSLGDGRTVAVDVSADGDAWVVQGEVSESPWGEILPDDPLASGRTMQIRVRGTGTTTAPVFVRSLKASMDVQQPVIEVRPISVEFGEGIQLRSGGFDTRVPQQVERWLLEEAERSLVYLIDEVGDRLLCKLVPRSWDREEVKNQKWRFSADLVAVVYERTDRWDSGSRWE